MKNVVYRQVLKIVIYVFNKKILHVIVYSFIPPHINSFSEVGTSASNI